MVQNEYKIKPQRGNGKGKTTVEKFSNLIDLPAFIKDSFHEFLKTRFLLKIS